MKSLSEGLQITMIRKNKLIIVLAIIFSFCFTISAFSNTKNSTYIYRDKERKQAVKKALNWVFENSATLENDRFYDVGEEIFILYEVYLKTGDKGLKTKIYKHIEDKLKNMAKAKYFSVKYKNELPMFLLAAYISKKLKINVVDFNEIIEREIKIKEHVYPRQPNSIFFSVSIWNAFLLDKLGFSPPYKWEELFHKGFIAKLPLDLDIENLPRIIFYEIAHEIFIIKSLGFDESDILTDDDIQFLHRMLPKALKRFSDEKNIDILSELLICAKLLNYTDYREFNDAIDIVLKAQTKEGHFGTTAGLKMTRHNPFRHTALVSIWALLAASLPKYQ